MLAGLELPRKTRMLDFQSIYKHRRFIHGGQGAPWAVCWLWASPGRCPRVPERREEMGLPAYEEHALRSLSPCSPLPKQNWVMAAKSVSRDPWSCHPDPCSGSLWFSFSFQWFFKFPWTEFTRESWETLASPDILKPRTTSFCQVLMSLIGYYGYTNKSYKFFLKVSVFPSCYWKIVLVGALLGTYSHYYHWSCAFQGLVPSLSVCVCVCKISNVPM